MCRKIMLLAVVVLISGCGTVERYNQIMTGAGCGLDSINGGLTVQSKPFLDSGHTILFTYENKSNGIVKPQISTIFYDANGNTLSERTVYFNNIDPGRSQLVTEIIISNGQPIKTMKVLEAVDRNRCRRSSECGRICGVYESTFTWK